jgi:hypothetical protein
MRWDSRDSHLAFCRMPRPASDRNGFPVSTVPPKLTFTLYGLANGADLHDRSLGGCDNLKRQIKWSLGCHCTIRCGGAIRRVAQSRPLAQSEPLAQSRRHHLPTITRDRTIRGAAITPYATIRCGRTIEAPSHSVPQSGAVGQSEAPSLPTQSDAVGQSNAPSAPDLSCPNIIAHHFKTF